MRQVLLSIVLLGCAAGPAAAAEETWACSIVDDGKPQVIKFKIGKSTVSMSDWRSRLMSKFLIDKTDSNTLRLILDNKDAVVAVSEPRVNRETGTLQEVSMDTYAIDKYTGHLTITTAATATKAAEIKGNCAR
ncbi:hypothetical protein ACVWZK_003093 [Bradyrhizobium sp. GM0.4]